VAREKINWSTALARLFQDASPGKPDSIRALAKALADQAPEKDRESWRKYLQRERIREEHAKLIAKIMGVPRATLPASQKIDLRAVHDRLDDIEDVLAELVNAQERRASTVTAEELELAVNAARHEGEKALDQTHPLGEQGQTRRAQGQ
jgi:hypothetical protein